MNTYTSNHRTILENIAYRAMLERDLQPDFPREAMAELEHLQPLNPSNIEQVAGAGNLRDMRDLLWASIDNDDSLDLDQLSVAEALSKGKTRVLVAIANVESTVKIGSAVDKHARHNTTSVYTVAQVFPMLPEQLSTNVTSLNLNQDRLAVVVDMVVNADGSLDESDIYPAWVRNRAKLAYNRVAAWLELSGIRTGKKDDIPDEVAAVPGLAENLQLQDRVAQSMKKLRHLHGALSLETIEAKPVFDGNQIRALELEQKNRANEIIENFMIAANGVSARYLSASGFPSIRRVVRNPKRWERIIEIASDHKFELPTDPDSKALEAFLVREKSVDPLRFPDLSLTVIKLLGAGEYIAELPDGLSPGHFGLAVKDYTHSTAPNRRYPDLLTQRLLKAAMDGELTPYSKEELDVLASHCTQAENAANKVERQVKKSAAALLLESRIGESFDAVVTGASEKGTWVRILTIPVEGKLVKGYKGMDIGNRLRVQLVDTNVERGYIDFKKV